MTKIVENFLFFVRPFGPWAQLLIIYALCTLVDAGMNKNQTETNKKKATPPNLPLLLQLLTSGQRMPIFFFLFLFFALFYFFWRSVSFLRRKSERKKRRKKERKRQENPKEKKKSKRIARRIKIRVKIGIRIRV